MHCSRIKSSSGDTAHEMNEESNRLAGVRALIFDLDGTLIDSKTDLAISVNATLGYLGRRPLQDETIYSYVGQGAPALIRRALGEGIPAPEVARGLEFFLDFYNRHKLDNTRLYPGIREALRKLADGTTPPERVLAVLTNKPVRPSRQILEGLGLLPHFRFVYGGNSFENKKPDPVGVYSILEDTRIPPSAAMMVGDSDVDIQTGLNAGVWTCGVTYGFGTLNLETNPPDLLIDSLPQLAEVLWQERSAPSWEELDSPGGLA